MDLNRTAGDQGEKDSQPRGHRIAAEEQVEKQLAAHRAILEAAVESLPFEFFALGPDGCYIMQNAVVKANWGDLVGRRPEEMCPDKETLAIWLENNRRALAGEKVEEEVELTVHGEKRVYYNIITPIREGAAICGILGVNIDITARKRAESALKAARDDLEHRVEERTAELAAANEHLQREVEERRRAESILKHLLQSSDHERQLIAYEIHDGLAQQLVGALMQFQIFDHLREMKPEEAAKAYEAGMTMLRQSHLEARRLISGVRPPILDESGIVAAIAHLIHDCRRRHGPQIEFQSQAEFDRLAGPLENSIYRIVQECLNNACKHSSSNRVRLGLVQTGDQIRIEIQDWGVGFQPEHVGEGCFGLEGIRERARLLGGHVAIKSAPGKGTLITVDLPLIKE